MSKIDKDIALGKDCRLDFSNPQALSRSLMRMRNDSLTEVVGRAGAWRVRHGKVSLCDLVVGALRCGRNPVSLFDSGDVT